MGIPLSPPENERKNQGLMNLTAVILCAGKGIRLRELTKDTPKPLLKLKTPNEQSIFENTLKKLISLGVLNFVIITGYKGHKIKDFIEEFKRSNELIKQTTNIIDAKPRHEKGPLYSFLELVKYSNLFTSTKDYLIIPGDTFFGLETLRKILDIYNGNYNTKSSKLFLFYRVVNEVLLEQIRNQKIISVINDQNTITSIKPNKIKPNDNVYQTIPVFLFSYEHIETISNLEKSNKIKKIKDAFNIMVNEGENIELVMIEAKYAFFDIDYKQDLDKLNLLIEKSKII